MSSIGNGWGVVRPLIYIGGLALVFLLGTGFGLGISSRWWVTPEPSVSIFVTATPGSTNHNLATAPSGATSCGPPPSGWMPYTIQPDDTLSLLARRFQVSTTRIMRTNCLSSEIIETGGTLYLPPLLTPTPCAISSPAGWTPYTIQSGDTLSSLSAARGISVETVRQTNCLASENITEGQTLYLPTLPTPTPCLISPPGGWELYTVQSGDTLFGLAAARGTTTTEVMRGNCLVSEAIVTGNTLYLPALPTPTPTQPPPPILPPTVAPAESLAQVQPPSFGTGSVQLPGGVSQPSAAEEVNNPFSRRGNLPQFPLWAGSPNAPEVACEDSDKPQEYQPGGLLEGNPWISAPWLTYDQDLNGQRIYYLDQGQRAYFFACDFPDPAAFPSEPSNLTALMSSDKTPQPEPLEVSFYVPPTEEHRMGKKAQGAVVWNAICNQPTGQYTLTIKYGQDNRPENQAQFTFEVEEAIVPSILSVPDAGPPGTTFLIYYCKFQSDPKIRIDLYYEAGRRPTDIDRVLWRHADSWDISIPPSGWTSKVLPSSINDPGVAYMITHKIDKTVEIPEIADIIWLLR